MGCEPPLGSDLVRAADDLLDILRRLRAERPGYWSTALMMASAQASRAFRRC